MPKYKGYVILNKYRAFEFEADDEDLAADHFETLLANVPFEEMESHWEETGPDDSAWDEMVEL